MGKRIFRGIDLDKLELKECTGGFILGISNGKIVMITHITIRKGKEIFVGDFVVSNGRMFKERGEAGIVIKIFEPFKNGRTTDVLKVKFYGGDIFYMKFKDLLP